MIGGMTALDVLVVESSPGAARHDAEQLEAAGHRVLRCHDPGEEGFPCRAVADPSACPIEEGVDVGLLVRRRVTPRPTEFEQGVTCILRAGIPLVEHGPSALDPYDGYVALRADGDVPAACEDAADHGYDALRESIAVRIGRLIAMSGHAADAVTVAFRRHGGDLRIELTGPPVSTAIRQALAVRVLDALGATGRTYGRVDVAYQDTTAG